MRNLFQKAVILAKLSRLIFMGRCSLEKQWRAHCSTHKENIANTISLLPKQKVTLCDFALPDDFPFPHSLHFHNKANISDKKNSVYFLSFNISRIFSGFDKLMVISKSPYSVGTCQYTFLRFYPYEYSLSFEKTHKIFELLPPC